MIFFKTVWVKLTSQGWPLDRLLCFKFSFQDLHEGISWGQMFFPYIRAAAAKSLQSCLTLCDRIDGSPPGSPVPGILQARALEWVAISFSNAWKWRVKVKSLSRVRLLATPWTAAYQASPSMGFSRQEYWSGVPLPSPTSEQAWWIWSGHQQQVFQLMLPKAATRWQHFFMPTRALGHVLNWVVN